MRNGHGAQMTRCRRCADQLRRRTRTATDARIGALPGRGKATEKRFATRFRHTGARGECPPNDPSPPNIPSSPFQVTHAALPREQLGDISPRFIPVRRQSTRRLPQRDSHMPLLWFADGGAARCPRLRQGCRTRGPRPGSRTPDGQAHLCPRPESCADSRAARRYADGPARRQNGPAPLPRYSWSEPSTPPYSHGMSMSLSLFGRGPVSSSPVIA